MRLFFVFNSILLISIGVILCFVDSQSMGIPETVSIGMLIFAFTIANYWTYRLKCVKISSSISADSIFILMFTLVHFYAVFRYSFLGADLHQKNLFIDHRYIFKSIIVSLIGLQAFILGYFWKRVDFNLNRFNLFKCLRGKQMDKVVTISTIYMALSLALYVKSMGSAILAKYAGSSVDYGSSVANVLLWNSFVVTIATTSISWIVNKSIVRIRFSLMIIAVATTISVLVGDRNMLLAVASVLLIILAEGKIIRIGIMKLIALVFMGSTLMGILGFYRSVEDKSFDSFCTAIEQYLYADKKDNAFDTLADSYVCVVAAVQYADEHGAFWGALHKADVIGVIPFAAKLFIEVDPKTTNSSSFLTWNINKDFSYGLGSSIIADLYLEFRWIGVLVGMFMLGFLTSFLRHSNNLLGIFMYWAWLPTLFSISRNTFAISKQLIWPVLIIALILFVVKMPIIRKDL